MSIRLKPQDITPLLSSPFLTTHGARVVQPLADILATPDFFDSVRSNLRSGDRVQLVRLEHGDWTKARVVEFVEVIIAQSTAAGVEFRQSGPLIQVDPAKPEPAAIAEPPARGRRGAQKDAA